MTTSLLHNRAVTNHLGFKVRTTVLVLDIPELNRRGFPNHAVLHTDLKPWVGKIGTQQTTCRTNLDKTCSVVTLFSNENQHVNT